MPSGNYPEVLARGATIDGKKYMKGDKHPAAGLSKNKYLSNGKLRKARKSRSRLKAVKKDLGFKKDTYLASDEYIRRINLLKYYEEEYDFDDEQAREVGAGELLAEVKSMIELDPRNIMGKEFQNIIDILGMAGAPVEYTSGRGKSKVVSEVSRTMDAELFAMGLDAGMDRPEGFTSAKDLEVKKVVSKGGKGLDFGERDTRYGFRRGLVKQDIDTKDPYFLAEALKSKLVEKQQELKEDFDAKQREAKEDPEYYQKYYKLSREEQVKRYEEQRINKQRLVKDRAGIGYENPELQTKQFVRPENRALGADLSELLTYKGTERKRAKRSDYGKARGTRKERNVRELEKVMGAQPFGSIDVAPVKQERHQRVRDFDEDNPEYTDEPTMILPETLTDIDGNPIELKTKGAQAEFQDRFKDIFSQFERTATERKAVVSKGKSNIGEKMDKKDITLDMLKGAQAEGLGTKKTIFAPGAYETFLGTQQGGIVPEGAGGAITGGGQEDPDYLAKRREVRETGDKVRDFIEEIERKGDKDIRGIYFEKGFHLLDTKRSRADLTIDEIKKGGYNVPAKITEKEEESGGAPAPVETSGRMLKKKINIDGKTQKGKFLYHKINVPDEGGKEIVFYKQKGTDLLESSDNRGGVKGKRYYAKKTSKGKYMISSVKF